MSKKWNTLIVAVVLMALLAAALPMASAQEDFQLSYVNAETAQNAVIEIHTDNPDGFVFYVVDNGNGKSDEMSVDFVPSEGEARARLVLPPAAQVWTNVVVVIDEIAFLNPEEEAVGEDVDEMFEDEMGGQGGGPGDAEAMAAEEPLFVNIAASDGCFANRIEAIRDLGDGWYRVRETVLRTDLSNGRFEGVEPGEGETGDWPTWAWFHRTLATRELACGEIQWDISMRMIGQNDSDEVMYVQYEMQLDLESDQDAYSTAASGPDNRLGLFLGSVEGVEVQVNGVARRVMGEFVYDSPNPTTVALDSQAEYEFDSEDIAFADGDEDIDFGETADVLIVPIEREYSGTLVLVIRLEPGDTFTLWYGEANDVPEPVEAQPLGEQTPVPSIATPTPENG